jgi:NAD(P)-dependent dehydrogenase (short-subunit alcohol dehydrogenase family)
MSCEPWSSRTAASTSPQNASRAFAGSPIRVAVVSGGSTGIGAVIARRLAERDWFCVLVARREELLRPLADELHGEYPGIPAAERSCAAASSSGSSSNRRWWRTRSSARSTRDRAEVFVPRWYRAAAIAQALAPGVLARATRRRLYRARDE